jgi:hypothetical protein
MQQAANFAGGFMKQEKKKHKDAKQGSMKQRNIWIALVVLILVVAAVVFFTSSPPSQQQQQKPSAEILLTEMPVTEIALSGPAADPSAEFSGLAWYGDNLILLPQYPNIFDESGDGSLFYLPKAEIVLYLNGARGTPLTPRPIKLIAPDLADQVRNYQGFESIGFSGDRAFFTIEAGTGTDMQGYLISGTISADLSTLTLDTTKLAEIPSQAVSANHSDESILVLKDKVLTFYEVNGEAIVADPVAHVFDYDLNSLGTIPMSNLEYRLTDTAFSNGNVFWGINYFFPGDKDLLPKDDPILDAYGTGETHAKYPQVERLVQFQYSDSGIKLLKTRPILLALTEDARNWEGLVVLDGRGFLMVTDKFPTTILGFVPIPR